MLIKIKNFFQRYLRANDGAAAVEFALIAIPFLMMIFLVMESGRILWMYNGIQYALEETARHAALESDLTQDEIETYAQGQLDGMMFSSDELQITSSTVVSNDIEFIQIQGEYQIQTMISNILPGDFATFDFNTSVRRPIID